MAKNKKIRIHDYSAELEWYWPTIMHAWSVHGDKQPIIECDLAKAKVGAWPARDYIDRLSERTRDSTLRLYEEVSAKGGMMVFILDCEKRILQSYVFYQKASEPKTKPAKKAIRKRKFDKSAK